MTGSKPPAPNVQRSLAERLLEERRGVREPLNGAHPPAVSGGATDPRLPHLAGFRRLSDGRYGDDFVRWSRGACRLTIGANLARTLGRAQKLTVLVHEATGSFAVASEVQSQTTVTWDERGRCSLRSPALCTFLDDHAEGEKQWAPATVMAGLIVVETGHSAAAKAKREAGA